MFKKMFLSPYYWMGVSLTIAIAIILAVIDIPPIIAIPMMFVIGYLLGKIAAVMEIGRGQN